MEMEEKKVLHSRANIFRRWREKEWWFTYVYDERAQVYLSWSFVRSYYVEKFRFWLYDIRNDRTWTFDKSLFLDKRQRKGVLDLRYRNGSVDIAYQGDEGRGAMLHVDSGLFKIDLDITRSPAPFTKRDNAFTSHYALLHHFHNHVRGTIEADGARYEIDTTNSYYDHCYGRVPSRTGWQWLAVQNGELGFASLVNHGAHAQKYTQVYFRGEWIRLSEDVTFDYDHENLMGPWRVTSSDVELAVRPIQMHGERITVPPIVPFLVNLTHNEFFVEVTGRIRFQGVFHDVGTLHGVMEEHYGRW